MKKIKLSEVAEIRGRVGWKGYTLEDLTDVGPLVLGANDITLSNQISFSNVKHISQRKYDESPEIMIKKFDILVVKVGTTVGKVAIIDTDIGEATINPNCVIVRATKINPYYLYYYLCSPFGKKYLVNNSSASGQPALNQKDLSNMLIPIVPIDKQKSIVNFLNPINKKNNLNNTLIDYYNKLLKMLYSFWFLQFNFPYKNNLFYSYNNGNFIFNKEIKMNIPDFWSIKKISEIIKINEKSIIQVNSNEAKTIGAFPFFTSGEDILRVNTPSVDGVNMYLSTGGNAIIKIYYGKASYSTDTWCINAGKYTFFLYFYLMKIKKHIDDCFFAGSGLKHLQKKCILNLSIPIPDDKTLLKFNSVCSNIFKHISILYNEIYELNTIISFLLPELLNGRVVL